jgi:methylmalonyl-CoA mutase N-terminal domain/subunit
VSAALDALEQAARGTDNLLPRILHAVENSATLGEISDTLRRVFGEQHEQPAL